MCAAEILEAHEVAKAASGERAAPTGTASDKISTVESRRSGGTVQKKHCSRMPLLAPLGDCDFELEPQLAASDDRGADHTVEEGGLTGILLPTIIEVCMPTTHCYMLACRRCSFSKVKLSRLPSHSNKMHLHQ